MKFKNNINWCLNACFHFIINDGLVLRNSFFDIFSGVMIPKKNVFLFHIGGTGREKITLFFWWYDTIKKVQKKIGGILPLAWWYKLRLLNK